MIAATESWTFSSRSHSHGFGCVPFFPCHLFPSPDRSSPPPTSQYSFTEQGFDPFDFVNGTRSKPHSSPPARPPVHPPPVTVPIECMGHAFDLRLPAIAQSASLAYFARLDAFPLALPPYRAPSREWDETDSPTTEDIEHYNNSFRTRTVPRGPGSLGSPSTHHDWDWLRAVAGDPFMSEPLRGYTPGILTGKWRGTELVRPLRVRC